MPAGPRPAPPDDTVRLILSGTIMGHPWVAIQWLSLTATTRTGTDLNTLLGTISTSWSTRFTGILPTLMQLTSIEGVWKTPGGGEVIGTSGAVHAGTNGGAILNEAAACTVISWHLNAYYRGGHPRTYMPGVLTANVTNGSDITAGVLTAFQTAALGYLTDINAMTAGGITGTVLGTVSFAHANAWRSPPIFRGFTGVSISPKLGTQRRRIGR